MTVEKRYEGINHELLSDVICDIIEMEGFSVTCERKNYAAGAKSGIKVFISGKRDNGSPAPEQIDASIVGQLDAETVVNIWGCNSDLENTVSTGLNAYFQSLEVTPFSHCSSGVIEQPEEIRKKSVAPKVISAALIFLGVFFICANGLLGLTFLLIGIFGYLASSIS